MGVYDTYDDVQLKAGDCLMKHHEIGDYTTLPDGVYVCPEGVVVILDKQYSAKFDKLISKWGDEMDLTEVTNPYHPLVQSFKKDQ